MSTLLVFYALAAFGLAFILGHSKVSLPVRQLITDKGGAVGRGLADLLECPACLGFWTGLLVGAFVHPPEIKRWVWLVTLGLFTSGSNFVLGKLTGLIR